MSPIFALILGVAGIALLLRTDRRQRPVLGAAMLVPGIFLLVAGSRPLPYWFGGGSEGGPLNTGFFLALIVASLVVLSRRRFSWASFPGANRAIFLLYGYFAVSALWADDPPTSLKRLCKDFLCVLIALIVATEKDPVLACRTIFIRIAYVLFPLSLVFGKYFPSLGRSFSYTGEPMFTGVTLQKNSLGEMVLVFGLMIAWELTELANRGWKQERTRFLMLSALLALGVWLLLACDSKTSLVCLLLGGSLLALRRKLTVWPNGKGILLAGFAFAVVAVACDKTFGLSEMLLRALNRNPTFTGRTDIWNVVLDQHTNPLVGCGFYMFWDTKGPEVARVLATLQSAHNGYIEIYLDGGIVGCALLGVMLLALGRQAFAAYFANTGVAAIALPFWVVALVYNFSESSFFRLDPLWLTFLIASVRAAAPQFIPVEPARAVRHWPPPVPNYGRRATPS